MIAMQIRKESRLGGFTLVELMVAVAITVVLLGVLFNITAVSADTLTSAKNKVEMNKRAEIVLDQLEVDIASIILRDDDFEWFYVGKALRPADLGPNSKPIEGDFAFPNTLGMVFYTAAVDKYDGYSGTDEKDLDNEEIDRGGDVCMVNYMHDFTNPLASVGGSGSEGDDRQLQLMRFIKFPNESYRSIASDSNASAQQVWEAKYGLPPYGLDASIAGGVYSVSAAFELQYTDKVGDLRYHTVAITPDVATNDRGDFQATFLRISGKKGVISDCDKLFDENTDTGEWALDEEFSNVKVRSVTYTITFLDDEGENYLRQVVGPDGKTAYMDRKELVKQHGYSFTRVIDFP